MADWESDLLAGLAQRLAAAGAGTYRPTGGYTADETAIVFGELPAVGDRALALAVYAARDAIEQNLSTVRVQVLIRSAVNNSLDCGALAVAVFDALHASSGFAAGTAYVVQCNRVSAVPLGMDENKRYERADNYELTVNTPASAGRP